MRIAFLLPAFSTAPVGGFKVVYEYANHLADRGHEVSALHPFTTEHSGSAREKLRRRLRAWYSRFDRRALVPWMAIDPRVSLSVLWDREAEGLPEADALVATSWHTADQVAAEAGEGKGFYLIQGYETWLGEEERVRATWRLPLHKIVISHWLEEIAIEMGEGARTSYVPIGLEPERWEVDAPVEERPARVGLALSPYKLRSELIGALSLTRGRIPELTAVAFGTGVRPSDLPSWVEYAQGATSTELRQLYNSCSIFLQANRAEGWGLPAAEAMACGCALVTNDTGGSREYATDRETARVVGLDPDQLGEAMIELATDRELRLELSRRGRERVGEFTWTRSVDGFERQLLRAATSGDVRR